MTDAKKPKVTPRVTPQKNSPWGIEPITLYRRNGIWYCKQRKPENPAQYRHMSLETRNRRVAESRRRDLYQSIAIARGLAQPRVEGLPLTPIIENYLSYLEVYYGTDRRTSYEMARTALTRLKDTLGHLEAATIGPRQVLHILKVNAKKYHQGASTVSKHLGVYKRLWRWAVTQEFLPPERYTAIDALRAPRPTELPNKTPKARREPIALEIVEKTLAHLPPILQDAIHLQYLLGARPSEILTMRTEDIDTTNPIWVYTVQAHKHTHLGRAKRLLLGPKAQAILKPHMDHPGYIFSPHRAIQERRTATRDGNGRRPNQPPTPTLTDRSINDAYDAHAYRRAITRACDDAGVPRWTPYQLRHARITAIEARYGLEAARLWAHDSSAAIVEAHYIHRDLDRLREIAEREA